MLTKALMSGFMKDEIKSELKSEIKTEIKTEIKLEKVKEEPGDFFMHPLSVDAAMAEFLKSEVIDIKEEDGNEPPLAGAVAKAPPAKPGFGGGGVFAGLPTPAFPASSSGAS